MPFSPLTKSSSGSFELIGRVKALRTSSSVTSVDWSPLSSRRTGSDWWIARNRASARGSSTSRPPTSTWVAKSIAARLQQTRLALTGHLA